MSTNLANNNQQRLDTNANPRLHPSDDSNIAHNESKTYNPTRGQRDMRRLGKHQQLKVRSCTCRVVGNFID
jgi:hypothetical protein